MGNKRRSNISPIVFPATPGATLLKVMRKVAENEAKYDIRFKVINIGGKTLQSMFQSSNPAATPGVLKKTAKDAA